MKSRLETAKYSKEYPSLQRDVVFIVRFVHIDMAIDVGIDHLIGDVSTGRTEKSSAPKIPTPIPFTNLWKFLLNLPRAAPFGNLHEVTDRNMRLGNNRVAIGPRPSLAETVMFRLKTLLGGRLTNPHFETQTTEADARLAALNTMTRLGMPEMIAVVAG